MERRASVGQMRSEARRPYVTAIFQHGSWSGRAHSRHQDALPLRIPTMILGMCSFVIPRTRFRALAAQEAEDGNATPADRNVQPSTLTSFQQLRGRIVQHWHSAEKYAKNRYTSAENSTRQSASPICDFPLPLLSTCFSLFLPSGSTAREEQKPSQLEPHNVTTFQQMQPQGPFPRIHRHVCTNLGFV